jgi:hypothetical protein
MIQKKILCQVGGWRKVCFCRGLPTQQAKDINMIKKFALQPLAAAAGIAVAGLAISATAVAAPLPAGFTCVGDSNCGTLGADGNVTASPQGGEYGYVVTAPGVTNNGDLNIGIGDEGETNSSVANSPTFSAGTSTDLKFYFNYITSDGAQFTEYAWVQLINAVTAETTILFTARTTTSGDTVPGNGLPGLAPGVTLTPASTAIIPGATNWSPLGEFSGECFSTGCGSTGWIAMDYEIPTPGNYYLQFGVVNWLDESYDTGLAFDGITINGVPIDPTVPEPATLALAGLALAGLAATRRRRHQG